MPNLLVNRGLQPAEISRYILSNQYFHGRFFEIYEMDYLIINKHLPLLRPLRFLHTDRRDHVQFRDPQLLSRIDAFLLLRRN